jgi:radical SAM-linked protein
MRLRITFSKGGTLAYASHLDLMRVWERALRRAGVPLAYSQGFNPRPKLQLAAALPLGHTAEAELLDVWLERSLDVAPFAKALVSALPDGLAMSEVRQVVLEEPALPTQVVSAEYRVEVVSGETAEQVEARIEQVLAAEGLLQEQARPGRAGKQYDLRPLIERLWLEQASEPVEGGVEEERVVLGMRLAAREGATARPEAVLEALGMGGAFARYRRRRLVLASRERCETHEV